MRSTLHVLRAEIRLHAHPERARIACSFFKTARGEYGEGDRFLGLTVPEQRAIARKHHNLSPTALRMLLVSPWHEERFIALVILTDQFARGTQAIRARIARQYRASIRRAVNNWDLVDTSAYKLLGEYCAERRTGVGILAALARSPNLWERRVAMIATLAYTVRGNTAPAFRIARMLLRDPHDLIHKATGWMLREVGKRNQHALEQFLERHAHRMPRTMLRYAVERFASDKRARYLAR